jgi:cell division protein FtsL
MSCSLVLPATRAESCFAWGAVGIVFEDLVLMEKLPMMVGAATLLAATIAAKTIHHRHATASTSCASASFACSHLKAELARVIFKGCETIEKLGTNLNTHSHHTDAH